jgi:CRP-like cAMP-binding protein
MTATVSNALLKSLPPAEQSALKDKLEPVPLPINTKLYEAETVPRYLYLPTSGIASVVNVMSKGNGVEVGLVGREGVVGSIYLIGSQLGLNVCILQVAGSGYRIPLRDALDAFAQHPVFRRRVLEYIQYETLLLSQLSACNRIHEVEERLARWLLMVSDRTGESQLHLTQEFLSQMLGTRRSTVTVTAGALQRAGLIEYGRGQVKIIDRTSLENAACECYPFTRKVLQNLYQNPR